MSADPPLISAIVTSYNHERYLRRAIESALAQDVEGLEVIVVDDASSDGSRLILEELAGDSRLRIELHGQNLGISRVFNRGLELARGTYVAYLGSDDYWLPGHLAGALAELRGTEVAVCYGRVRLVDVDDRDITATESFFGSAPDDEFFAAIVRRSNFVPFISAIIRRDVAIECGGFDEELFTLQDYDLWIRIAAHHRVRFLDRTTASFRWSGSNASSPSAANSIRFRRELNRILERLLDELPVELRRIGAESVVRDRLARNYRRLGKRVRDPVESARYFRLSLDYNPRDVSTIARFALSRLRAALARAGTPAGRVRGR